MIQLVNLDVASDEEASPAQESKEVGLWGSE